MLTIDIPGRESLEIRHLVLDYNGTIAVDGKLLPELRERLQALQKCLEIHVLTADTYGTVRAQCEPLGLHIETFPQGGAARCKAEIVERLAQDGPVCCFGNGYNDYEMFKSAALAVAILETEGLSPQLLNEADVLVRNAADAFDLLLLPDRLRATLRT